jgi:hypothetical protein
MQPFGKDARCKNQDFRLSAATKKNLPYEQDLSRFLLLGSCLPAAAGNVEC